MMCDIDIRVLWLSFFLTVAIGCHVTNWESSIKGEGYSTCDNDYEYITGFTRDDRTEDDQITSLKGAVCCDRTSPWNSGFWASQTVITDWWTLLNWEDRWAQCPNGFFLAGLYTSKPKSSWFSKKPDLLENIEEGRCTKPGSHPYHYGHCYDQDIDSCFDKEGTCRCHTGYFVTGIYKDSCEQLHCLDKLKCCQMAPGPDPLDGMDAVKTRTMDDTLQNMALLAYYLGYSWCSGCRTETVGEDFRRQGDTWFADKSRRCEGYKSDERLKLVYGDWKFKMVNMTYGQPVVTKLKPETVDSGTIYNNDSAPSMKLFERTQSTVRTVSHTTTSSWKNSHDLHVQFSYSPPYATGLAAGVDYKFGYETSSTTSDSSSSSQGESFTVKSEKVLAPYTAARWEMVMSKMRTTVSYVATIAVDFSTEFQGFLRYGGGYDGPTTNFHYEYRGSKKSPTFNYRFGDEKIPFYKALEDQSRKHSLPWMWTEMENYHPYARKLIKILSDENRYTFKLKGIFQDTIGQHVNLRWTKIETVPPKTKP